MIGPSDRATERPSERKKTRLLSHQDFYYLCVPRTEQLEWMKEGERGMVGVCSERSWARFISTDCFTDWFDSGSWAEFGSTLHGSFVSDPTDLDCQVTSERASEQASVCVHFTWAYWFSNIILWFGSCSSDKFPKTRLNKYAAALTFNIHVWAKKIGSQSESDKKVLISIYNTKRNLFAQECNLVIRTGLGGVASSPQSNRKRHRVSTY